MEWYYAQGSERRGPLDEPSFRAEVQKGVITPATLIWRKGMNDWVTYSQAERDLLLSDGLGRCVECGSVLPKDDLVQVKEYSVCARCKETFIYKLSQGMPVGGAVGFWRRGRELVVAKGSNFPARCVKCNAAAPGKRLRRRLYWHHPALCLMILFPGLLIYAIVAVIVRQRATFDVSLCDQHRSRRLWTMLIAWFVFFASIGCFFLAGVVDASLVPIVVIVGIVGILAAIIGGVYGSRVVYAKKIDTQYAHMGGICPDFMAEYPDWPEIAGR